MKLTIFALLLLNISIAANCQNKGVVYIIGDPGYRVFFNDEFKGITHIDHDGLFIENIKPGEYLVQIKKRTSIIQTELIHLEEGEIKEFRITADAPVKKMEPLMDGFYIGTYLEEYEQKIKPANRSFNRKADKPKGVYIYLRFNDSGTGNWGVITTDLDRKGEIFETIERLLLNTRIAAKAHGYINTELSWTYSENFVISYKGGDPGFGVEGEYKFADKSDSFHTSILIFAEGKTENKAIDFKFIPFENY